MQVAHEIQFYFHDNTMTHLSCLLDSRYNVQWFVRLQASQAATKVVILLLHCQNS